MKIFFTACICSLFLLSCKKEITELPPATQTGANTFGAKVNGEFWVPQGFGSLPANDILEARMSGTYLIINARNFSSSPTETEFEIRIKDVVAPGTYVLNANVSPPSATQSYAYYVKRRVTPLDEWVTASTHTGIVHITRVDTVNLIVSGTFEFSMKNLSGSGDPLTVTEGRFDLKLL